MRIIRFREKLGGFYAVEQVRETFGLADSTFQRIMPFLQNETQLVKKLDLNKAGVDELKMHPYIKYNIARAIISYREQHGSYTSVESLKNIGAIDKVIFEKIQPYLFATK